MGYALLLFAYLLRGFNNSVVLRAIPLPAAAITDACSIIGAVVMLAWIGPKRWHEIGAAVRAYPWHLFGLGVAIAGCTITFQWAIKTTTVANAMLAHAVQPFITCLVFVPLWGGGRPSIRGWLALVVGIVGMGVVFVPQFGPHAPLLGVALSAISAAIAGWFNVQLPYFHGKVKSDTLLTCMQLFCAITLLPAWLEKSADLSAVHAVGFGAIAWLGVVNFAFANVLHYAALERISVGHGATLSYVQPITAVVVAALWLGEPLTATLIIGGFCTFIAGALVIYDGMHFRKPPS